MCCPPSEPLNMEGKFERMAGASRATSETSDSLHVATRAIGFGHSPKLDSNTCQDGSICSKKIRNIPFDPTLPSFHVLNDSQWHCAGARAKLKERGSIAQVHQQETHFPWLVLCS